MRQPIGTVVVVEFWLSQQTLPYNPCLSTSRVNREILKNMKFHTFCGVSLYIYITCVSYQQSKCNPFSLHTIAIHGKQVKMGIALPVRGPSNLNPFVVQRPQEVCI